MSAVAAPLQSFPVSDKQAWESTHRPDILRRMQEVMGPLPRREKNSPVPVRIEEEVDCGRYIRRFLTFEAEPGSLVPAYLLVPKSALGGKKTFGILTLHQTHPAGHKVVVGLGHSTNDEYAVELVNRGYVCLAPAYPKLAEYQPDLQALGYQSGTMKAILDNMRGLDLLESLPYVERGKFAAIGHSLGGHNSLFTAAFDERIKVVVTSCGFDSFRDYMGGVIKGWTSERYMPRLLQFAPDRYPFDFHDVLAAIAPRAVFVSAPKFDTNFKWDSVDRVAAAARPVYKMYDAAPNLIIEHPETNHVFQAVMLQKAYELIERILPLRR